jgi:hypothetical protein
MLDAQLQQTTILWGDSKKKAAKPTNAWVSSACFSSFNQKFPSKEWCQNLKGTSTGSLEGQRNSVDGWRYMDILAAWLKAREQKGWANAVKNFQACHRGKEQQESPRLSPRSGLGSFDGQ